ncbi:MAG: thymidylate kinase [Oscillospiraceae bacterium]|nr:thymidylate kinase [Oscillospiraceae bacterium]
MAKLIVIEGGDASGKETQTALLCDRLRRDGKTVERITFPDYESPSSALVKMYLGGEFGSDPGKVNPYAASLFYAVDRFASHAAKWGALMETDAVIVADRYVTSNIIYQAAKFEDEAEKRDFIRWVEDIEYNRLGLPRPDEVLFLNMEPEAAAKLMAARKNKITDGDEKDIHERDAEYLKKAYDNACFAARISGWTEIKCSENGMARAINDIHENIIEILKRVF